MKMSPVMKLNRRWLAALLLVAVVTPLAVVAQNPHSAPVNAPAKLTDAQLSERVCYMLGRSIAEDCKRGEVKLDMQSLSAGIADFDAGKDSRWSEKELNATMRQFAERIQSRIATNNQKTGEAFLAANAKKPGVKTTASGLQYKVMKEGDGASPKLADTVICHYRGTFIAGGEFDSSYRRGQPARFPVSGVIGGWTEALQLMKVGAKYQLFVPSELAYGANGNGEIGPNETLIFEVELLDIAR